MEKVRKQNWTKEEECTLIDQIENTSGMIADEDVLIVAADKRMTTSDRIRYMFESTPAFGGISGAVDNFVVPHENTEPSSQGDFAVDVPIQDAPEVEVRTLHQVSKKSRKRKLLSGTELHDCPSGSERRVEMRTSDLLLYSKKYCSSR